MQQAARIHPQTRCWGRVSRLTGHKQREAAFPGNTRPPRNRTRLSEHRRFRSPRQGLGRDTALAVPAATPVPALLGPPLPPTARPRRPDQNQPSRPRPWRGSPRPYLAAGAILTAYGNRARRLPAAPCRAQSEPRAEAPHGAAKGEMAYRATPHGQRGRAHPAGATPRGRDGQRSAAGWAAGLLAADERRPAPPRSPVRSRPWSTSAERFPALLVSVFFHANASVVSLISVFI